MMNKKGEADSGPGFIIKALVAAFVLVIVILGVYLWISGKGLPFFQGIPSFNQTKPVTIANEIFSYNLSNDRLAYYDGNNWVDVPKAGIEVNGKKFDYTTLKADLTAHFIGTSKEIQNNPKINAIIVSALEFTSSTSKWNLPLRAWQALFGGGTETLLLYGGRIDLLDYSVDPNKPGFEHFYILLDNSLYRQPNQNSLMQKVGDDVIGRSAMNKAIEWRDGLINNTVTVHYGDQNNNGQTIETCLIREYYAGKKMLVVDLSRQKDGGTCPYLT